MIKLSHNRNLRGPLSALLIATALTISGCSYKSAGHIKKHSSNHVYEAGYGAYDYANRSSGAAYHNTAQSGSIQQLPSSRYGYETACVQNLNQGCGTHLYLQNYNIAPPTVTYANPTPQPFIEAPQPSSYSDVVISEPEPAPYTPTEPLPFIEQVTDPAPQPYYPPITTPQTSWLPPKK